MSNLDKSGQTRFNGRVYTSIDIGDGLSVRQKRMLSEMGILVQGVSAGQMVLSAPENLDLDRALRLLDIDLPATPFRRSVDRHTEKYTSRAPDRVYRILVANDQPLNLIFRALEAADVEIVDTSMIAQGQCEVRLNGLPASALAAVIPLIWMEEAPPEDEELRYRAVPAQRANMLHGEPYGLAGKGIVIGVGDAGKVGQHLDLDGRVQNFSYGGYHQHATHVTGIIAARPNLDPAKGQGVAPDATIVTAYFSDIITSASAFSHDFGMVLTNNSYGSPSGGCTTYGSYNLNSVFIDAQMYEADTLLHVFAAGNSGRSTCAPYDKGFRTVLGGWQSAKNVLCVGMTNHVDGLTESSSRGPVNDGRIKPDVVAVGNGVTSTRYPNTYDGGGGTSYSAPGVAGLAGLLYQRYKQLHDSVPDAALIKGILMNTSDDLGRKGPDYKFGYGRVNGLRAVAVLDSGQYFQGTVDQSDTVLFPLEIPAGLAEVDIMLSWIDPAGLPYGVPLLVNDVDVEIEAPGGEVFLPWVLDPSNEAVNDPASKGRDSLNPQEQITIQGPESGTYTVRVIGHSIPVGVQKFFVTYTEKRDKVRLTYPCGGEHFVPGTTENIRWDAFGSAVDSFALEYTTDGTTWTPIAVVANGNSRHYQWTVPDTASGSVRVRVSAAGSADVSGDEFAILDVPDIFSVDPACHGYALLQWGSVAAADHYNIYRYCADSGKVLLAHSVDDTSAILTVPGTGKNWFGITAALEDGTESRRTTLKEVGHGEGSCPWTNEVRLGALTNAVAARMHTSSALDDSTPIGVQIINFGQDTVSTVEAGYRIGEAEVVDEIFDISLLPGDTADILFNTRADLSATGDYELSVWIVGMGQQGGDTVTATIQHLDNAAVALPLSDGFENLSEVTCEGACFGLANGSRWDFISTSEHGRLSTNLRDGFEIDGARSVTMDAGKHGSPATNKLTGTFNLVAYDTASNDIRLSFEYFHHASENTDDSLDQVWIRGSDTSDWIAIHDLFETNGLPGEVTRVDVKLTEALKFGGQNFSSSFQVRFVQQGGGLAIKRTAERGYTFDNITLFTADSDIEVMALENPLPFGCGLGAEPVTVRVSNTSPDTLWDIPLAYTIDSDGPVFDTIEFVAPERDTLFSFVVAGDFSIYGAREVEVWAALDQDTYRSNDTVASTVVNTPLASDLPYLEDFETGSAGWVATGSSSSFELGVPSGPGIITRAPSGAKAWVTNLDGLYNANEESYLVSPCFDLSGMAQPVLSFALIYQIESGYDAFRVEYSTDSENWEVLGEKGQGTNWYNDDEDLWEGSQFFWRVASYDIPVTASNVRFRFAFTSDIGLEYEGVGIDLVHIHEKVPVGVAQTTHFADLHINGDEWIHLDTMGSRYFSIHPNGQDLGEMEISVFADTTQTDGTAHYLGRHWLVRSPVDPAGPAGIRMYFTDSSATNMLYQLLIDGVYTLSDPFAFDAHVYAGSNSDSLLVNNDHQVGYDIGKDSLVIVPYDNGYYVELLVQDIAEFWVTSPRIPLSDSIAALVRSGSDDVHEYLVGGVVNMYDSVIETGGHAVAGLRFEGLYVPRRARIHDARLVLHPVPGAAGHGALLIEGFNSGVLPAFRTANYDISMRPRTGAYLKWNTSFSPADTVLTTPSIRHILQELVNRDDWGQGGSAGFVISGDVHHGFWSEDGDSARAAKLIVEFDTACTGPPIVYVDADAAGSGTGASWQDAFTDLQAALDLALHCGGVGEVWVAEGTYIPAINSRDRGFQVPGGLRLYGGFHGAETSLAERDPLTNPVTLSGDIGVIGDTSDNSYHIVVIPENSDTVFMDGFIIDGGMASGQGEGMDSGAGISAEGYVHLSNSIISNCRASDVGGAIYQWGNASVILTNCTLELNSSPAVGGSQDAGIRFIGRNIIRKNYD